MIHIFFLSNSKKKMTEVRAAHIGIMAVASSALKDAA